MDMEKLEVKRNFSFSSYQVERSTDCFVLKHNLKVFVNWKYCFIVKSSQLLLKANKK